MLIPFFLVLFFQRSLLHLVNSKVSSFLSKKILHVPRAVVLCDLPLYPMLSELYVS